MKKLAKRRHKRRAPGGSMSKEKEKPTPVDYEGQLAARAFDRLRREKMEVKKVA